MSLCLCHPVSYLMLSPSSHTGSFLFLLLTWELLILLFITVEHLHVNPFFLSPCCL